ncbi:MAG TPA: glutamyl-tRNA reductase [Verrucomicrobiae bacterium]|jgi:glutamyl-tRNA reductase|nr:glutamyl-tRNA reductase [Verrucomicrobiae bacterium]
MSFFVFGINHKSCPVEIREKIHFDKDKLRAALAASRDFTAVSELVILSTCNRVEFFGYSELEACPEETIYNVMESVHGAGRETFSPFVETRSGKDAIHYIFRVAAGLESLVIGENEILSQFRDAFRMANEEGTTHSVLYRLMEKALKIGKDVRHKTKINEGAVSIPSVAVELAEKIFGKLAGEKVMVVGTGEMGLLTLRNLKSSGAEIVYVASRDAEHGEKVATEFGAERIGHEDWSGALNAVDILITSTASAKPLITADQVRKVMAARRHRPLFVIDIAVPRNVDAHVHAIDDVYLYNIDDLKGVADANLNLRRKQMSDAEELTRAAVLAFSSWLEQLKARPTLERFETFLDQLIERELDSGLRESGLDEARKRKIKDNIRSRLLHAPIEKIKEASQNGGVKRYLEALRSLFDLDPHEEPKPENSERKP